MTKIQLITKPKECNYIKGEWAMLMHSTVVEKYLNILY